MSRKNFIFALLLACSGESSVDEPVPNEIVSRPLQGFEITLPAGTFITHDNDDIVRFEGKEPVVYDVTVDFDYVDNGTHPWVTQESNDDGTSVKFVHNVFGETDGHWITVASLLRSTNSRAFMFVLNAKTTNVDEAIAVFNDSLAQFRLINDG